MQAGNPDQPINIDMVLHYGLKTLCIFALIFAVAMLTPWLAKQTDRWIANYREHHEKSRNPEDRRLYSVRSIYELPPERQEKPEQSGTPELEAETQDTGKPETKHKKNVTVKKVSR